jgi:hypothetical protein
VYRLVDTGTALQQSGAWASAFTDATLYEVTSPVITDGTYTYFGGRTNTVTPYTYGLFRVRNSDRAVSSPVSVSTGNVKPRTAPAWGDSGGVRYLFLGSEASSSATPTGSRMYRTDVTNWGATPVQRNRDSGSPADDFNSDIVGPTYLASWSGGGAKSLYSGEKGLGYLHAVEAFGSTTSLPTLVGFPFRDATYSSGIEAGLIRDFVTGRVFWGDDDGDVFTVGNYTGAWVRHPTSGWNYQVLASYTGKAAVRNTSLYLSGVLWVPNAGGRLLAIDVNSGTGGQSVIRTYNLGTAALGEVLRDWNTGRVYVPAVDGRLYAVPDIADPTSPN